MERLRLRGERPHGVRAARLKIDTNRAFALEARERFEIGGRRLVQPAQHQCAGVVRDRDFDLREPRGDRQPGDERRERVHQAAGRGGEDPALVEVGNVGCRPLPEADQHAPLARDELHAEPRTPAVRPGGPRQRLKHAARLDAAQPHEVLEQLRLLEGELRGGCEVLQCAAAAEPEMRTLGRHPVRTRAQHLLEHRLVEIAAPSHAAHEHPLARQRVGDEHGLAVDPGDSPGLVREIDDVRLLGRDTQALHAGPAAQAARNSARCGLPAPSSQARTMPHSRSCSSGVSRPRMSSKRR